MNPKIEYELTPSELVQIITSKLNNDANMREARSQVEKIGNKHIIKNVKIKASEENNYLSLNECIHIYFQDCVFDGKLIINLPKRKLDFYYCFDSATKVELQNTKKLYEIKLIGKCDRIDFNSCIFPNTKIKIGDYSYYDHANFATVKNTLFVHCYLTHLESDILDEYNRFYIYNSYIITAYLNNLSNNKIKIYNLISNTFKAQTKKSQESYFQIVEDEDNEVKYEEPDKDASTIIEHALNNQNIENFDYGFDELVVLSYSEVNINKITIRNRIEISKSSSGLRGKIDTLISTSKYGYRFYFQDNEIENFSILNTDFSKTEINSRGTNIYDVRMFYIKWSKKDFYFHDHAYGAGNTDIEFKEEKRNFYNNLKSKYINSHDTRNAIFFHVLEMKSISNLDCFELKFRVRPFFSLKNNFPFIKTTWSYITITIEHFGIWPIVFNNVISQHSLSWIKPILWLILLNLPPSIVVSVQISKDMHINYEIQNIVDNFIHLLLPVGFRISEISSRGFPLLLISFLKVVNAIIIYQLILSFRKYSRKF